MQWDMVVPWCVDYHCGTKSPHFRTNYHDSRTRKCVAFTTAVLSVHRIWKVKRLPKCHSDDHQARGENNFFLSSSAKTTKGKTTTTTHHPLFQIVFPFLSRKDKSALWSLSGWESAIIICHFVPESKKKKEGIESRARCSLLPNFHCVAARKLPFARKLHKRQKRKKFKKQINNCIRRK